MNGQAGIPVDIYARVSRLRDRKQTSTPAQVAVCRAVLDERGLPAGQTWVDDGKSAWNPEVYREDWEAMMARLEDGLAGGVIVFDLERFARQLKDGERLVKAAERGLLVLDSEKEYDLTKPGGKRDFRNAIVAAEYYSDQLRVKVKRGKRAKAMSGRVDQRRSFGFEADGITPHEHEAAIIRDHAARLLAGETQDSLMAELTGKWGYPAYRKMITRPKNAGIVVYQGEPVSVLPEPHILDRLTHDRLVAMYAARKPGKQPSGRYVLSGIAVCGACGAGLSGRPVYRKGQKEAAGNQYWCRECRTLTGTSPAARARMR